MIASYRRDPKSIATVILACAAAASFGVVANQLAWVLTGLMTLLPVASHVRWVGWRRALTEPSFVTIILFFYISVFPQRGLAIATSSYSPIELTVGRVTGAELTLTLALASVGTTLLVECFHFARQHARSSDAGPAFSNQPASSRVLLLAGAFAFIVLTALAAIIAENNGFAGAVSAFASHAKSTAQEARSFAASIWAVLAVPAVWCAALVVTRDDSSQRVRWLFLTVGLLIVVGQVLIFGSRLNVLVAMMGAWFIVYSSGRRVPVAAVLAAIPIVLLLSVSILSQRSDTDFSRLPAYERYSQVAAYGVLDASLALRERPGDIRDKLTEPSRWLDLPLYLTPSFVWPDKPRLDDRRLDVYVVEAVGTRYQQDSGFPTGYTTEMYVYGGWPAVLLASAIAGLALGRLDRRLVGPTRRVTSPSSLIWYCFVVNAAFTYYKDGDVLVTAIGQIREGTYLGLAMLVTGVWTIGQASRGRPLVAPPILRSRIATDRLRGGERTNTR